MSLLQSLPYKDYQKALLFSKEQSKIIAISAGICNISFDETKRPGEQLLKVLDRSGYTVQQYKLFVASLKKPSLFNPASKIAILIGNYKYTQLNKLATPEVDCQVLSNCLKSLGFYVITLMNTSGNVLKDILKKIFSVVPEDSYCFIFYAGHGCEVNDQVCMLSVDCPLDNWSSEHCVTQSYVLHELASRHVDMCVFVMDMCRLTVDRNLTKIFHSDYSTDSKPDIKNLLICYSTSENQYAYEAIQLYTTTTIDSNMTYVLDTNNLSKVIAGSSQYVEVLSKILNVDLDVVTLFDRVHFEVEKSTKHQKPTKIQYGDLKRSLHDLAKDNASEVLLKLKEIQKDFQFVS